MAFWFVTWRFESEKERKGGDGREGRKDRDGETEILQNPGNSTKPTATFFFFFFEFLFLNWSS